MDNQNPINNNNENEENKSSPEMEQAPQMTPNEDKPVGPAIGTIIIVLVLIIGGFYIWGSKVDERTDALVDENKTGEDILAEVDETTEALDQQGTSDEIADIESDLLGTDLDNLDTELQNIDAELAF